MYLYHISSLSTMARENPTAPLKPPHHIINCSLLQYKTMWWLSVDVNILVFGWFLPETYLLKSLQVDKSREEGGGDEPEDDAEQDGGDDEAGMPVVLLSEDAHPQEEEDDAVAGGGQRLHGVLDLRLG